MINKVENRIVQILDKGNKHSGTGFFISNKGYIVTCHHVIYALEEIWIRYIDKLVQAIWCEEYSNIDADIAVLKIESSLFKKIEIVRIVNPLDFSKSNACLFGFPSNELKHYLNGYCYDKITHIQYREEIYIKDFFKSDKLNNNPWSKKPKNNAKYSSIRIEGVAVDKGASGGLVYIESLDGVVGIIQAREKYDNHTNAIRWENFLDNLTPNQKRELGLEYIFNFSGEYIETKSLIKALEKMDISRQKIQQIANRSLPLTSRKTLLGSIDKIVEELSYIEDYDDSKNIPILCFAKKINSQLNDKNIDIWIRKAEEYFETKTDELKCKKRELKDSYNILIEVSIANNIKTEATIQIYKNIIETKLEDVYKSIDIGCSCCKSINLYDKEQRRIFVDELIGYLQKFENPNKILLEFALPKDMIDLNIPLWEDGDECFLSDEYNLIYRLKERFNRKYYHGNRYWKPHWNTYRENKDKTLIDSGHYIDESEIKSINREVSFYKSCIVTKFPIYNTDIFKRVLKFGISIVISPHALKTDELKEFNSWFTKELDIIEVQNSVKEINHIFGQYEHSFRSNIILIWDNYNRVPEIYKGYRLGE
jgi:hypothetical protein